MIVWTAGPAIEAESRAVGVAALPAGSPLVGPLLEITGSGITISGNGAGSAPGSGTITGADSGTAALAATIGTSWAAVLDEAALMTATLATEPAIRTPVTAPATAMALRRFMRLLLRWTELRVIEGRAACDKSVPSQGKPQVRTSAPWRMAHEAPLASWDDGDVKALVVEDDPSVFEPLISGLERNGIETVHVAYATHVIGALRGVDIVLLDLGLPDGEGLGVLREIRAISDVPVIIATARGDETDRIIGLELGADDYVVKPFSVRELAARIRAIARRRRNEPELQASTLVVDRNKRRVQLGDREIELTAKEFDLLAVLAEEPGKVFTRQELFTRVWDPVWVGTGKTLDVHIGSLRKKLDDADLIHTVRGVGYRLNVPE